MNQAANEIAAGEAAPADAIRQAAGQLGIAWAPSVAALPPSRDFLAAVPIAFARQHCLLGLAGEADLILLAMPGPEGLPHVQTLRKLLGKRVQPLLAPADQIRQALNAAYQQQPSGAQQVIEELNADEVMRELQHVTRREDLLDVASRSPVIKLVNLMLFEAVKRRASDVHVQPYEGRLVVRLRIDGVLHDIFTPPSSLQEEIISRIKIMGGMNIAERRLAQDGRATVEVGDRHVDLRIATLPTSFGERAVIRLLDKSVRLYGLEEIGMPASILGTFRRLIHLDHGILLVTGPTGSGKSTTLYGALRELNATELNIITLEDPIEYRLEGISQTQVSEKKGMTFASGLRHVLRQDPDVIMVGEIRDAETAHMAIQSALTGHLVFSTLHTNDASGAVARMLDLGVEPYLLASSLLGVLAQRLVRRICPRCAREISPSPADLARWGLAPGALESASLRAAAGCDSCMNTGYYERMGIFELLNVSGPIRELILQSGKAGGIKTAAMAEGMTTLWADGVAKAAAGVTTMDEVLRVAGRDEGGG